jgi:hypothetical protein
MLSSSLAGDDPWPIRPGRLMADMLGVSAGQVCDPITHSVLMKPNNGLVHILHHAATILRYASRCLRKPLCPVQARIVAGVTMLAESSRACFPSFWPIPAGLRRSPSLNRGTSPELVAQGTIFPHQVLITQQQPLIDRPCDVRHPGLPMHATVSLHRFLAHWRRIWGMTQLQSRQRASDG